MNHQEKLLEIYKNSSTIEDVVLPKETQILLSRVGASIESQKGVFTVLLTLAIHKILNPSQDIRYFQVTLPNGFSGRSVDTKFITPTLKQLGLPSMSESGWLTRSLEQPYPYTKDYNGKISKLKAEFLAIVDYIQHNPDKVTFVCRVLLNFAIDIRNKNTIEVVKIENPEKITIDIIITSLNDFIAQNYHIGGGSKIPVLAFYAIYSILVNELKRYEGCVVGDLGSHTSSDRTSKASGDIEVFLDGQLLEALEIKFGIEIDNHIINRVLPKIHKANPKRYYILSTLGIKQSDLNEIEDKVFMLKQEHGCQLIINGLLPTLKYYLRLIHNLEDFVQLFTQLVYDDKELKIVHKEKWTEIIKKRFS
ncbi:hypothetical protein [Flavobacterium sp.]|jgi:DNA (cytosine-5)-methyltransferase 1|uniref:hypothetical protein n=1 Tax=Flavobacterium sp. TaxID=239 RepID=UPI0037C04A3D